MEKVEKLLQEMESCKADLAYVRYQTWSEIAADIEDYIEDEICESFDRFTDENHIEIFEYKNVMDLFNGDTLKEAVEGKKDFFIDNWIQWANCDYEYAPFISYFEDIIDISTMCDKIRDKWIAKYKPELLEFTK